MWKNILSGGEENIVLYSCAYAITFFRLSRQTFSTFERLLTTKLITLTLGFSIKLAKSCNGKQAKTRWFCEGFNPNPKNFFFVFLTLFYRKIQRRQTLQSVEQKIVPTLLTRINAESGRHNTQSKLGFLTLISIGWQCQELFSPEFHIELVALSNNRMLRSFQISQQATAKQRLKLSFVSPNGYYHITYSDIQTDSTPIKCFSVYFSSRETSLACDNVKETQYKIFHFWD